MLPSSQKMNLTGLSCLCILATLENHGNYKECHVPTLRGIYMRPGRTQTRVRIGLHTFLLMYFHETGLTINSDWSDFGPRREILGEKFQRTPFFIKTPLNKAKKFLGPPILLGNYFNASPPPTIKHSLT